MRYLFSVLALMVALMASMRDANAGDYADANAAFVKGEYDRAIELYEGVVSRGIQHEDLYYNLGNAYFRANRLGPAVYNYERALRIEPGFDDASFNARVAREVIAERIVDRLRGAEEEPWWVRAAMYFSLTELTLAFLVLNFLFFLSLGVLRFSATGFTRSAIRVVSVFLAVAALACAVFLERQHHVLEERHQAIVVADQVLMREGPDSTSAERGQLHPGLRVRVLDRRPSWLRVRLSNGVEGWVPAAAIGEL